MKKSMKKTAGRISAVVTFYAVFLTCVSTSVPDIAESMPCTPYTDLTISCITAYAAEAIAYQQSDGRWGSYPFNHRSPSNPGIETEHGNTIAAAGCSLMSVCNCVSYKTGKLPSPCDFADYACNKGFRVEGTDGVTTGFFRYVAEEYGAQYGFSFSGQTNDADIALAHIRNGGAASYNIYGH